MVKIAVAGASGQVAQEIIDALIASKRHHITLLSRKEPPAMNQLKPEMQWKTVDYHDLNSLIEALQGIHTLLSFIQVLSDIDQKSQKNLIDAAIAAGVKRFAPSEYGSRGIVNMPWWHGKEVIRDYLAEINKEEKVLEYTLFQPGLFLDYLAFPYKTAKYVEPLQSVFDFANKRAMVVSGHEDAIMTLTTVADVAAVVSRAIDYEDTWPRIGGIRGNGVTFSQVLEIGQLVRGSPFSIEEVELKDLEAGELKTSWGLEAVHHAVAQDQSVALLKQVSIGILISSSKGAWDVSDDFNQLFPEYHFTPIDEFLTKSWRGKA